MRQSHCHLAMEMTTSVLTGPFLTIFTVPGIWFRALIFMVFTMLTCYQIYITVSTKAKERRKTVFSFFGCSLKCRTLLSNNYRGVDCETKISSLIHSPFSQKRPSDFFDTTVSLHPSSQPDFSFRIAVKERYIRFDVKKWCPIKDVNVLNNELAAVYGDKPHNRNANRVRAAGSTGSKDAVGYCVQKRGHGELAGGALVERIDKDDPGETFEISKPLSIFLEDFHGSPNSPCSGRLDGHARKCR